jgi:hypothetical protein
MRPSMSAWVVESRASPFSVLECRLFDFWLDLIALGALGELLLPY